MTTSEQRGQDGYQHDGTRVVTAVFGRLTPEEFGDRERREGKIGELLHDEQEDTLGKAYDQRLVSRLLGFIAPYRNMMIWAVILMAVSSVAGVASPWIVRNAIDDGIIAGDIGALRLWIAIFAVSAVVEWLTNRQRIQLLAYVGTRAVADVRSVLFRHLHELSLDFYNNYSVGRLMSRLISDVQVLQDFITWSITGVFRAVFRLAGIVVFMLLMNWQLALVAFLVLPIMAWITNYWRTFVRDAYRASRQRLSLINGYLNETISGIRVTKSFGREPQNSQHFDDLNRSFFDKNVLAARLTALFFPSVDVLGSLATALVVGVGGWLVLGDAISAGTLVAFVLYVDQFFLPIRELAQRYNVFQSTMASSERIFGLLDREPDLYDPEDGTALPPIRGEVVFENVHFAYKPDEPVLKGISLQAKPGERIALVGETGAGKSTVIRLVARFFDVTGGSIRIDGHDVRAVTRASLRSQLGIVLQDTFLFSGTVADNIRYGKLDASDEDIVRVSQAVGAHDFIARMPNGYETEVGENGVNLSVGQRQLVSFARALLSDPRILILDEATSSVDTTTEKQIDAALDTLMEGRTSFVIAHRLNTIVNADQIVVMDQGEIVETGTHEALLAQRGRYFKLYTMQWAAEGSQPKQRVYGD